ncbi:MAG: GNAT family N-acetyltransferase [Pseudonocardiaceae bacterium]
MEIGDPDRVVLELHGGEGRIVLRQDVFDSEVFERKIGRITEARAPLTADYVLLLQSLVEKAQDKGFSQLLRRTGGAERAEAWALERAGFELMDIGVTFGYRLGGIISPPTRADIIVRAATEADITAMINGMMHLPWGSRYESDPAYTPEQVHNLRTRWLWNSYRGRATAVLVGEIEGQAAGFATCVLDEAAGTGDIDLVGTLPSFRGRGAASHLVAHALAWFSSRCRFVTVRTQATNTAAAGVYERAGFTLHSSDITFRLNLDKNTVTA